MTDYLDAAKRHRSDADLLNKHQRWPNADQLCGLAAECALKAVMAAIGMPLRNDGAPHEKHHRVHIERFWDIFVTFAEGRGYSEYAALLGDVNLFADWSVEQRYHATASIKPETVVRHRTGMEMAWGVVAFAKIDGRLP